MADNTKKDKVEKKLPWRPRKFQDVDELYRIGMEYIDRCKANGDPLLITGLADALDTTRDGLCDYQSGKYDEEGKPFSDIIKKLKIQVEMGYESLMHSNKPVGGIFVLKNMGWKDTQHIEQSNKNVEPTPDELEKIKDKYGLK